ncbi:acyltransferase family protein [Legionella lytica]|uniref:Acyltransferase family protein n=1 Tax=Legionella lytica TaxID=96232 RepID=A0ABW8D688_9GAMM
MSGNSERILSLDVFRGLTMALMVLVNSQGTNEAYPLLDHATWNGCTFADLVFPAFLFIVGVTTVISLKRQTVTNPQVSSDIYKNIFKRTALLFLFGLFLNAFPLHFDFATIRIYGILQRIAICYFVCSLLYLNTSVRIQAALFIAILLGYWYLMVFVPVPGGIGNPLSMTNNWVLYIDQQLLSPPHFYRNFDPEGLLSTIPAVATTLMGVLTGSLLLTPLSKQKKCFFMVLAGLLFLLLGWLWSYSFPINKNLWSSSFVLWVGGISLWGFALCFYVIDILGYSKWALPFKIFGMNALLIFLFHVLLLKLQAVFTVTMPNGASDNLRVAISEYLFGSFSQENAGLFYSFVFLFLNFLFAAFLYRRKMFFKL